MSRKEVRSQGRSYRKGMDSCLHSLLYAGDNQLSPGTNGEKEWLTSQGKANKSEEDLWLSKALPDFSVACLDNARYNGPLITNRGSSLPGKERSNTFIVSRNGQKPVRRR